MLVDSHCHLDFGSLAEDRAAVLDRAWRAGVETVVTICTRLSRFGEILEITKAHERIYCSVGVHPHNTDDEGIENAAELIEKTALRKVVGIGETGLDYFYTNSHPETQRASFIAHIAAARETGLPLIVHARDADRETMEILTAERERGAFPGVIHCFTGSRALAERAIALGLYISFSGILTFKKADELRAIARDLPEDRLLVETDAPFLAPVPHRGKTNEPSFVVHTAQCLASVREMPLDRLAQVTSDNFYRLFNRIGRLATVPAT
ncbi:MAG: TatD family hydrolase [Rhodospirillaceae bacterium]|nr:TatD family hydrolase [Rhodospirillaceae bacterium]